MFKDVSNLFRQQYSIMKRFLKFPDNLPLLGGIWGFLIGLSYFGSLMFGELIFGRPSSTWSIGLIWLPAYAALPAIGGLALGFAFIYIFKKLNISGEFPTILFLLLIIPVIFSMYASASIGLKKIKALEADSSPHVIIDSRVISRVASLPFTVLNLQPSVKTWDLSTESDTSFKTLIYWITGTRKSTPTISWNKEMVTVLSEGDIITIRDNTKKKIIKTDLSKYNYTRELWAVPIHFYSDKPEYLAVFANLRCTSDRAIILVYDPQGSIVYHELLERKGCDPTIRKITNPSNFQECLEVKTHETFYLMASR